MGETGTVSINATISGLPKLIIPGLKAFSLPDKNLQKISIKLNEIKYYQF